ncbi:MAG: hypothetical protein FWE16_00130 [Firmicutes bacterium]|nr:hypothetical protein [Bacillota bacterium]
MENNPVINELIQFIISAGNDLANKSGKVEDIGVKKQWLTEEDLRIEREIKRIVTRDGDSFFAEEENDNFIDDGSVWVVDPISGTKLFIEGKPNFAIVASHLKNGKVDFAVVNNPTAQKLYLAEAQQGVSINGKPLEAPNNNDDTGRIIFHASTQGSWNSGQIDELRKQLSEKYQVFPSQGSCAYNYCLVVQGEFDGVVSLTKDSFPEFAGCFIANMTGGVLKQQI